MDINLNLTFQAIKRSIDIFLHRFHVILFVIIILGGLAVVILLLNNDVIRSSQSDGYTSNTNDASFDQTTIKKIQDLQNRNQTGSQVPANARTNPFIE